MTTVSRTLYEFPLCPFCRKVRLLLFEKGLSYNMIQEIPWARRPEFLKINPAGMVPVLIEPDGYALTDHVSICEYINEIQPSPDLMRETPRGRAEVRRLTNWFDSIFYWEVYKPLVGEKVEKALRYSKEPDSNLIRAGRANLKRHLMYTDWLCARRNYLAGRYISMADLAAVAHLSVLDYLGEIEWDKYPSVKEWYSKIKRRDSFNALLTDRLTGIIPSEIYANLDF